MEKGDDLCGATNGSENRTDMTMYGQKEVENSNDVQIVILDVQDWIRRWKNSRDVDNFAFQISCGLGRGAI